MENFSVDTLKQGLSFTDDILLDNLFILLPKSVDISDSLINILKDWGIKNIACNGSLSLKQTDDSKSQKNDNAKTKQDAPKEKPEEKIKKIIETSKNTKTDDSEQARMTMVEQVYDEYLNYIEQVFTHYVTHKEIDKEELAQMVQNLCIFIKEHHRYILRINKTYYNPNKNFLLAHSMRTTVLSIAIAQQLHVPLSKMIELGITCIIHEIGMLKLPPQIYMANRKLNASEKLQITKHTLLGYSIAKDLNFSLPIQLGILEHHEKANGTGYPRHLTGNSISSIARIIAVTCTYEAITSPRTYKDEKSSFDALLELIANKENQYDSNVLKALLLTVSLYPIGTYVYLSNRKIAEVIDSNQENPKYPVVQLLTEKETDGRFKIIQTSPNNIYISRILSKQEEQDILNLLNEKKKLLAEAQKEAEKQNTANLSQQQNLQTQPVQQTAKQTEVSALQTNTNNTENKKTENSVQKANTNENKMEEVDINFFN